jgi:hypothetical protein
MTWKLRPRCAISTINSPATFRDQTCKVFGQRFDRGGSQETEHDEKIEDGKEFAIRFNTGDVAAPVHIDRCRDVLRPEEAAAVVETQLWSEAVV